MKIIDFFMADYISYLVVGRRVSLSCIIVYRVKKLIGIDGLS